MMLNKEINVEIKQQAGSAVQKEEEQIPSEFLTFTLGDEEYAIDILKVQEIRGYEKPTLIANAPTFIKGVTNLRGTIVPIIDLRIKFNLGKVDATREDFAHLVRLRPDHALSAALGAKIQRLFEEVRGSLTGAVALTVEPADAQESYDMTRLGFEPVFVNHKPRPNGISGDYVQTRWRLKANPDVTCTVYDSWEGGGGATFLDFDAPWNPQRIHGGCNLSWPNYTLDRLHSLGKVLFEGDRSEFEEPDSGNLDLRGITPDPVREKMRELGLRMERDDSHDSNGDDSDEEYWCKYDQGELRDLHRSRLALYAHVDRTAGTVAIVDVETGKQATLGFDKLLKLNRVEYGKRRACS